MVTYVLTRRLRLSCRHLDASKIRIKTTYQSVHEMCYKDTVAEAKAFWSSFNSFISSNSNFALHRKKPVFNNQEVDLYRLYRTVEKRGGYAAISERKAWKEIAGALQIEDKGNNAGSTLKQWYLKYLQPFKEYSVSRNASGAGMLCDAVETAIYGREKVAKSKRERTERGKVEELDADMDADMDAELDEVEVEEVEEVGEVVAGLLDLMPEEDIEARKVGEAQPRQQAGQAREGGTPPKKERSATGEEEDEEDEEVSAMVCEACRGGHYEDQVCWLIQGAWDLSFSSVGLVCEMVQSVDASAKASATVPCLSREGPYFTLNADYSVRQVRQGVAHVLSQAQNEEDSKGGLGMSRMRVGTTRRGASEHAGAHTGRISASRG
jgi:hypothetical protein